MAGLSLKCVDCGALLRSVEEAEEHAELTSHSNFAESVEAVLNLVCSSCGKPCRSKTVNFRFSHFLLLCSCCFVCDFDFEILDRLGRWALGLWILYVVSLFRSFSLLVIWNSVYCRFDFDGNWYCGVVWNILYLCWVFFLDFGISVMWDSFLIKLFF